MTIFIFECWDDMEDAPEAGDSATYTCEAATHKSAAEIFAYDELEDFSPKMDVAVREVGSDRWQVFSVERTVTYKASRNMSAEPKP